MKLIVFGRGRGDCNAIWTLKRCIRQELDPRLRALMAYAHISSAVCFPWVQVQVIQWDDLMFFSRLGNVDSIDCTLVDCIVYVFVVLKYKNIIVQHSRARPLAPLCRDASELDVF